MQRVLTTTNPSSTIGWAFRACFVKTFLADLQRFRFWRHFAVQSFACVGFFAVVIGILDALLPGIFEGAGRGLGIAVFVVSLLYGLVRAWPRPIQQTYSSPNITVRLVEGDLFEQPGHLVVGMSSTFDTSVPHIVQRESVQGQFLRQIYHDDLGALDADLAAALVSQPAIGSINKPGKTERFAIGTVATIREHTRCFFCLAYTDMDEQNVARGTVDGIWRALDNLWKAVSASANGGTVAIPVIGGGQARLSQVLPAQDSIRFIIMSFVFASRKEKICDELNIVVQSSTYEALDRLEIQAFLKSLKHS